MAVWARQKYPHLVDAVWASSAPINMILEYPQAVVNAFNTMNSIGGSECGNIIANAFRTMESAAVARNFTEIERRLNFCEPIDMDLDENIAFVFYTMARHITFGFVESASYTDVDLACARMRGLDDPGNEPETDFEGFARWFADDLFGDSECNDFNLTSAIALSSDESYDVHFFGLRQLTWLYCTQLGQFPSSGRGDGHPFGGRFNRQFFINWCSDIFGDVVNEDFMEETIADGRVAYGGLNPRTYRTFFTHGEMDPRHQLGPNEDLNDLAPVIVMSREFLIIAEMLLKCNNSHHV